jgi:hydroxypyruvate isomerase
VIRFSAHLGTLFGELAPLERPAAARAAGFAEVEAWWPVAPLAGDWIDAAGAAGVRVVLVNADGGDLAAGERGFCNIPGREDEVLAAVGDAARVVRACGGDTVNLLVGRIDPARALQEQLSQAREVVRAAAHEAARQGARIVVEHLNALDVDGPLLATPAAAAAFVRAVDHEAVRLLYDAYHAARAGLDPVAEVDRVADLIGHVQYADSPGRGAPGTGAIDIHRLVERLDAVGYEGPIGLEFVPAGGSAEALTGLSGWMPRGGAGAAP